MAQIDAESGGGDGHKNPPKAPAQQQPNPPELIRGCPIKTLVHGKEEGQEGGPSRELNRGLPNVDFAFDLTIPQSHFRWV